MKNIFNNNIFETAMDQYVYTEMLNTHADIKKRIKPMLSLAYQLRISLTKEISEFDFNTIMNINDELNNIAKQENNFAFDNTKIDTDAIIEKYGIVLGFVSSHVFDSVLKDSLTYNDISDKMKESISKLSGKINTINKNVIKSLYDYEQYIQYSLLFQNLEALKEIEKTLLNNFKIDRSLIASDFKVGDTILNLNTPASVRFFNELCITEIGRVIIKNLVIDTDTESKNKKSGILQRFLDKMYE